MYLIVSWKWVLFSGFIVLRKCSLDYVAEDYFQILAYLLLLPVHSAPAIIAG